LCSGSTLSFLIHIVIPNLSGLTQPPFTVIIRDVCYVCSKSVQGARNSSSMAAHMEQHPATDFSTETTGGLCHMLAVISLIMHAA
jgi:hypothetical protein